MEKQIEIREALDYFLNEKLEKLICSNPRKKDGFLKMAARPVVLKGELKFQIEEFTEKQAFHKNLDREQAAAYIMEQLETLYRNLQVFSKCGSLNLLVSKKGAVTFKLKRNDDVTNCKSSIDRSETATDENTDGGGANGAGTSCTPLSESALLTLFNHNRKKNYIFPEGRPIPFLVDLGIMTPQGAVVKAKYDKFRQINRFLEFIEDILPKLNRDKETTIIDFGCGKSYLTFAMYYYLKEQKRYPIQVVGLDLKKDVIALCNRLSEKFGFDHLHFYQGDIAGYEGLAHVDMVVTLHACDTATDYAIAKAVKWGAEVILSVPCCQHELNRQLQNELMSPVLKYGLIKERMAALLTDGIRAELLEQAGYRTQILEFIDMEHTPKNIMLRAVKQNRRGKSDGKAMKQNKQGKSDKEALKHMMEQLHVEPTLYQLLKVGDF